MGLCSPLNLHTFAPEIKNGKKDMKTKTLLLAAFATISLTASAITQQNDGVITVKASKASQGLVKKWIEGYKQVNPDVQIELVSGKGVDADLTLVNQRQNEKNTTYVGRYALLPVTSVDNPLLNDLQRKEWKSKDLKKLFFKAEDADEEYEEEIESKGNKLKDRITVYSGSNKASVTSTFASHFGRSVEDLRGNKIAGDDIYLLSAIGEDKTSVTFNPIANLYNLSSRTLRSDLAMLPLAGKKEQSETLKNGNLDDILSLLENTNIDLIPVEEIGFTYTSADRNIDAFLLWVVNDGQQYNHQQGFLRLNNKETASK